MSKQPKKHGWFGGITALTAACLYLALPPAVRAHGELHELIEAATLDIIRNPDKPILYLKRAELHRAHLGWDAAMADVERASALTNDWPELHLARAGLFLDAQWFASASMAASRVLASDPDRVEALLIRARARARLGEYESAADDYTRLIKCSAAPGPEMFLERAQALVGAGAPHFQEALRGLEQGLDRLGPLVTLQLAAIDLEVRQDRLDDALARIDRIMAPLPRKESWLARRGEILQRAGRFREAAAAFQQALAALNTLPAHRRAVPAMLELADRIRAALAELPPDSPHSPAPAPTR